MSSLLPTSQQLQSMFSDVLASQPFNSQLDNPMESRSAVDESAMESTADMEDNGDPVPRNTAQQASNQRHVSRVLDNVAIRVEEQFQEFIMRHQVDGGNFVYRDALMEMYDTKKTTLQVNFHHLSAFSQSLADLIQMEYIRYEPFLVLGVRHCVERVCPKDFHGHDFMVAFTDLPADKKIRDLKAELMGQLTTIKATITRTSIVRPELIEGTFQCGDCQQIVHGIKQQYVFTRPEQCPNDLCNNSENWKLMVEKCKFVDWQKCRVQENSTEIPAGSVPRSMDVIVRHEMCERPKPGDTCVFTGTLISVPDVAQLMMSGRHLNAQKAMRESGRSNKDSAAGANGVSGMKGLGCREMSFRMIFIANNVQSSKDKYAHFYEENDETNEATLSDTISKLLTPDQREEMLRMIDSKSNYEDLISSIAPTIYGHNRIKEGLLLLMLGGVHKRTPEGTNKLRGDINVCIVGDPGLSKSQFLKYVSTLLPRGIYTSGKASSAAGLTAAVMKDEETGDFCIEAGALMLADNGICCIDEFDKMDIKDQVAIHETMEQQTISIAKAGIHATLNARTSILAAANPIAGRYDKSKSLKWNVNLSAPIMSRFDLFFVLLDEVNEAHDFELARHILKVHRDQDEALQPKYSVDTLRRFILFARALKPKLTEGAKKVLIKKYKALRQKDSQGRNGYHITVRQLESLIRLSEAMARAQCESEVKEKHVRAAASLLQNSIVQTENGDVNIEEDDDEEVPVADEQQATTLEQDAMNVNMKQEPGAAQKPKMKLKADEYMRIVRSVISMLQENEMKSISRGKFPEITSAQPVSADGEDVAMTSQEQQDVQQSDADSVGMTFGDICQWHLERMEHEIENMDEYAAELKKIRNVLKRMVKHDRYLMAIKSVLDDSMDSDEMAPDEKLDDGAVLTVSPFITFDELTS